MRERHYSDGDNAERLLKGLHKRTPPLPLSESHPPPRARRAAAAKRAAAAARLKLTSRGAVRRGYGTGWLQLRVAVATSQAHREPESARRVCPIKL